MAQVFYAEDSDPAMQRAKQRARETFRYFWRELAWEARRIVPALDLAVVKAPFRDTPGGPVEEMWLGEVEFDGKTIVGALVNQPDELTSVAAGDRVTFELPQISDWMYVIGGEAFGGFSVQQMRLGMSPEARAAHDQAWGLDFGDAAAPRLLPASYPAPPAEHPMALNMGPSLEQHLQKDPSAALAHDAHGFTLLHHMALAGSASAVKILLAHGANPTARTRHGMSALGLAEALGWTDVVALLS